MDNQCWQPQAKSARPSWIIKRSISCSEERVERLRTVLVMSHTAEARAAIVYRTTRLVAVEEVLLTVTTMGSTEEILRTTKAGLVLEVQAVRQEALEATTAALVLQERYQEPEAEEPATTPMAGLAAMAGSSSPTVSRAKQPGVLEAASATTLQDIKVLSQKKCIEGEHMVSLYIRILKQGQSKEIKNGQLTEHRTMIVSIPTQTGFAMSPDDTSPVTLGDQLLYDGRWFSVTEFEPDIFGAVYKVHLTECKRLSEGVGSL